MLHAQYAQFAHTCYRQTHFADFQLEDWSYIMLRRQNAGISVAASKLTLDFLVKAKKSGG
jgi:hypothetical protein